MGIIFPNQTKCNFTKQGDTCQGEFLKKGAFENIKRQINN